MNKKLLENYQLPIEDKELFERMRHESCSDNERIFFEKMEYKELYEEYSKENDLVFNIPEDRRSVKNVFEFAKDRNNIHPTQKPQGLLKELTRIFSNKEDIVMDFTCGSGSEGMACISEGRRFIGIERDEEYFEKAWEWYMSKNKPFVFGRNS